MNPLFLESSADPGTTLFFTVLAVIVPLLPLRDLYLHLRRERWIAVNGIVDPRRDAFAPWRPPAPFSPRRARLDVIASCGLGFVLIAVAVTLGISALRGWTVASAPGPELRPAIVALQLAVWLVIPLVIALYLHTQRADFLHHRSQPAIRSFVPAMLTGHAGITRSVLPATRVTARIEYTALQLFFAYFWLSGLLDFAWDATAPLR